MEENFNLNEIINFDVLSNEITAHYDAKELATKGVATKHCILMHGWNSTGNDMLRLKNAIAALPKAAGYRFWLPTYDTNAPFINNAQSLSKLFKQQGVNPKDCLLVAYSMGGVVARSMYTQGFQFRKLITICSPHQGLAPWIPTPTPGTMSIAPWSNDLKNLNMNNADIAKRGDYTFFGITYNDARGSHDDDAVVEVKSATGGNLSGNIIRSKINLNYGGNLAGGDPHSRGMDPVFLKPAIQTIDRLL